MNYRKPAFVTWIALAAALLLTSFSNSPANKTVEAARINNLGVAYMNQQLFEKALKSFEEAAALDPTLQIAVVNQGIARLNLGQIDAAKPILEGAVKRDPRDAHAWYNLGLLYKNTGDTDAATVAFHNIQDFSDDADVWYFLGTVYVQAKTYERAVNAFQWALKLDPQHASAEFGLSRAFQQLGDLVHAREHLTRFQYITEHKLGTPISLAYGEQGKYSLAEESPLAPEKVPEQIKVRFVDVTAKAGLVAQPAPTGVSGPDWWQGSGACFLDYDNDGKIDIFLPDNGTQGGLSLYHNLGDGKFADVTKQAGLDPQLHGVSCTAGDFDNDGFSDLAVSLYERMLLLRNGNDGTFKDVAPAAGVGKMVGVTGLTFLDYDHDGDLDLYGASGMVMTVGAITSGTSAMWRNNGNGTFTNVTSETGVSIPASENNAIAADYNNDRSIDIIVADGAGGTIFQNPREGRFLALHPFVSMQTGESDLSRVEVDTRQAVGIATLDLNHDGWTDVVFTGKETPAVTLWRNNQGKTFDRVPLPETHWTSAYGIAAIDYDNDGWADLVAVGETADGKGEVRLFRNLGPNGFKDVTSDVGLDKIVLRAPRAVIVGDYDNDGATDILITQNRGPAVLLRNEGGNQNHWLRLSLKGLADNKSAIGTKVEVFSDGNRQKFEIAGSNGYLGQNSPYLTVGLGRAKQADIVRMLWPTGVLQDEVDVAADREHKFMEIDRRGSSCPTLFAWDGQKYRYIADMLGAGVVGHWVGPGQRNIPRPVEYIKLDRDKLRERDGKLSFRFMEPLEEAVYLDQVGLLAVGHPANIDVYPNEYFASNPPYPEFEVVASQGARPPAAAHDEHGHDVLPDLLAHRYFGDFDVLPFLGFAKPHTLNLDLGEPYRGGPMWLLMHGEIEYFSANSMYAADQAGLQPIAPYVEALGADGKWSRVADDMGFPAGGPRTMTADLTGKLPLGAQKIRITTNLQIYWDNILIDRTMQNQRIRVTDVPLARADLGHHGFPLKIEGQPPGNVNYIYEQASATGPYTHPAGTYTRYGDVLPLLTALDDKLVVFGSGDEVVLEFDPQTLPALPAGWTRDYFYVARGYEKDMDFYAYDFTKVEPLPFGQMGSYPYPGKAFPLDDEHLRYLLEYNTRYMSGNEPHGYAFDYSAK